MVVIIPRGHELSGKKEVDLIETIPYPQIIFKPNSGLRPVIDRLFGEIGAEPVAACEIEEGGAMAGMVAENFGIAVLPNMPILKNLDVQIIKIRKPAYRRYFYMSRMEHRYLSPVAEQFIQFMEEHYNYQ